MITIRLLGGAKKAVGRPEVKLDKLHATVKEILEFLAGISADSKILDADNLIIAVNGTDSGALEGPDTIVTSKDIVTIVTVVHGGIGDAIGQNSVLILGVRKINENPGKLIDRLRGLHPGLFIQGVYASVVFGIDHAIEITRLALEAEKRGIMLANKCETELILRLACTNQISEAFKRVGLREDAPGCFIAFSKDTRTLQRFYNQINMIFEIDDKVLEPSANKKKQLTKMIGIGGKYSDSLFSQYLIERAAILVK